MSPNPSVTAAPFHPDSPAPSADPSRWHDRPVRPATSAAASLETCWPLVVAVAGLLLGLQGGRMLWSTGYTAVAQIIRFETPDPQLFQPRPIAAATLATMIEAAEVRTRVGAALHPPLTAGAVAAMLRITPERGHDILRIAISGPDRAAAIELANLYAGEAVRFTQNQQAQEAAEAVRYLQEQLHRVEGELAALDARFRTLSPAAPRPALLLTKLDDARGQLADLLGRYTDAHPLVQEQRARIAALEQQIAALAAGPAPLPPGPAAPAASVASGDYNYENLREVVQALEGQKLSLASRLHLTEMLVQHPPGYCRRFAPATPAQTEAHRPAVKIALLGIITGLLSLAVGTGGVLAVELLDPRLKTAGDVRRVTRLPLLATLRPLERLTPAARANWAFRTWTALQGRFAAGPNHGLVCGFTSSSPGEGRSVWVRLLAEAANQCGYRVLTITTRPSPESAQLKRAEAVPGTSAPAGDPGAPDHGSALAAQNILTSPAEITQQLLSADSPPLVHIPLPGWVWNRERRQEWLAALNHWRGIDNLVILVELPPASVSESVLLAQHLPNLIWLTDGTRADAAETRTQLETLRQARCHVVGAVLNRHEEPAPARRLARWLPGVAAGLWLLLGIPVQLPAQEPPAPPEPAAGRTEPALPAALSIISPGQRAAWQQRLTLGPGDVLRLALYGEPLLTREEVTIQPDGTISYLEAGDVPAAGLTVDELRERLDAALREFRRAPRSMVAPVALHSKKYYLLGKVAQRGVFTLDRPLTVVEAVARAHGFETGLSGRNLVELADLSRSFLVRAGRRVPVDFARLFTAGDLTQNLAVEPGDYFYFPPADAAEVYLLGRVGAPGPLPFTENLTAVRALSARGGLAPRAWWHRVLVVRGSLSHPEPLVVNVVDVLSGRAPDLKLQPRDIVFVSERPWIRAEELLDDVATAFAQSVVVFWTTDQVIPVVPGNRR